MNRFLGILVVLGTGASACSGTSSHGGPPGDGGVGDAPGLDAGAADSDGGVTPGPPRLTDLQVVSTGDAASPILLTPPFSPDTFDYYVRCAAGTNRLHVTMAASPGAMSALVQPTTSSPAARQTLDVGVLENQALVATATAGKAKTEYWVRCLPSDFPPMLMNAHPEVGKVTPGYYLLGTAQPSGPDGYGMVIDSNGVPVWYMHARPGPPGTKTGSAAGDVDTLLPDTITFFSNMNEPVEIFSLGPPLKQTQAAPKNRVMDSHELRVLPNGDFLVPSNPLVTGVDLTGLTVNLGGKMVMLGPNSNILACNLVEFDPKTGDVTWEWIGADHLDPVKDTIEIQVSAATGPGGGLVLDAFHCNAIDVEPTTGNLLVSSRDMDSVFYIEKKTGRILWKLGGKPYTKENATYVPVDDPFYAQHDVRFASAWTPCGSAGGKGQISLFDDHTDHPGPARGIVMDVVVGEPSAPDGGAADGGAADGGAADGGAADGGAADGGSGSCGAGASSAKVTWQYPAEISSLSRGSFRILPDGSRVIGWGNGSPTWVFTEVNAKAQDLLDFYFTDGDISYRVIKVPLDTFDLETLRQTSE